MSSPRDLHLNLGGIEDEYEIIGELGRGALSVVYLARDRELGREVALKVIRDQYLHDAEATARFAREARTLAQLAHPNIITLYTAKRLAEGGLVLVMQLTHGHSLRELLRRDGAFPLARTEQVLRDMASALAYLHRRGVVHRDIKPENIFFDEKNNRTLLSDFGIAKAYDGLGNVTLTGVVVGTPAYMSPEQIDGAALDGQSDLYSLGLVGWELLTGQQPWEGESLYSIIVKQKTEALPALQTLRADVPEPLRLAIERAFEKDRSRRYRLAEELLEQLDAGASLVPQPQLTNNLPPDLPVPVAAVAAREEVSTLEFEPEAVAATGATPFALAAMKLRPRSRAYLAAAGVVLFAGGAAALPLLNSAPSPVLAEELVPPPVVTEPRAPETVAVADEPPPERVSPASEPATAPPAPPRIRETPAIDLWPAVAAPSLGLGNIPEPELAIPAMPAPPANTGLEPAPVPRTAPPASSNAPVLSPDMAPVLSNRRAVLRQMDRSYPAVLRDRQIGGTAVVSLLIDESGRVIESSISNSSGYEHLDAAALTVGRTMKFTPAQHRGRPVRTRVEMPLAFDASAPRE